MSWAPATVVVLAQWWLWGGLLGVVLLLGVAGMRRRYVAVEDLLLRAFLVVQPLLLAGATIATATLRLVRRTTFGMPPLSTNPRLRIPPSSSDQNTAPPSNASGSHILLIARLLVLLRLFLLIARKRELRLLPNAARGPALGYCLTSRVKTHAVRAIGKEITEQ